MKRLIVAIGTLLVAAMACGGGKGAFDPNGKWAVVDKFEPTVSGNCTAASNSTTLTVSSGADNYAISDNGSPLSMQGSYCGDFYCEMYGTLAAARRDVTFHTDGTVTGGVFAMIGGCRVQWSTTGNRQ